VFDQGLGRLFVVRTAGQVTDAGVLGSIEFGVQALGVPLVVVLGHDRCGAVAATINALESGDLPGGFIRDIVERVMPSALIARQAGELTAEGVEAEHVRQTARHLSQRSAIIAQALEQGSCAIVGLVYDLEHGAVRVVESLGPIQD
ncbi:MAG: carbonic anhydrase, partial [Angustibacter sp.]